MCEEGPLAIGAREPDEVDGLAHEEHLLAQRGADEARQHRLDEHVALMPQLVQGHGTLLYEELAVRVVQLAVQHPPGQGSGSGSGSGRAAHHAAHTYAAAAQGGWARRGADLRIISKSGESAWRSKWRT